MQDKVWKWDFKLSWELFSEAIYSYRQAINEAKKHKSHMHCKNGIFAAITSLEAFLNETLIKKHGWSKIKLEKNNADKVKLKTLINDFSEDNAFYKKFIDYKKIRNNYLVHHKENDYTYVDKINTDSLLGTIEAVQEIIARISFNNRDIDYPYWISGLNFLNPGENEDISLGNQFEYWRHIGYSCIDNSDLITFNSMMTTIEYPEIWIEYEKLHLKIWKLLLKYNFNFDVEEKSDKFPLMPYLSSKYWE